jgi:hypothetical protein
VACVETKIKLCMAWVLVPPRACEDPKTNL